MFILLHGELLHNPNAQYHFNDDNNLGMCRGIIIFSRAVNTKKRRKKKNNSPLT
jgi:hypothetical protein